MKKQLDRMADTASSIEKNSEEVDEVEDGDDETPDAVSFNQGKQEALESMTTALRDLQRTKLKAKERRRERDKLLKEQKQKKKVSLSKARLPPGLLDKLAQQREDSTTESSEKPQHQPQTESTCTSPEKLTDSLREENDDDDIDDDEDWDAEEEHPSTIQVIQTSKIVHPPPHKAALQFLQSQIYGARIPRESMAKNVSRKLKRYGKPGMNFCQTKPQGVKKKKKKGNKRSLTLD